MTPRNRIQNLILLLFYFSLPVYVYMASIATEEDACPVRSKHCTCSAGPFYTIYCKNITDVTVLDDIIGNFTEKTYIFEIGSLNWTSIPARSLENPFLMSLVINNSKFDRLINTTDAPTRNGSIILHHLSLENVTATEWTWDQLNTFKRLDILFTYNTTIGEHIPSNFSHHVSKSLKFLSVSQSNLSSIEPDSFQNLKNLTYLRISHSKLRTLTRNILPSPSKLGQLRLDHNLIASLPDDMFSNMPNLTIVSLSNNRISVLSEEVFRPLWRPTVYLELRNNPIKCDCRMLWIVTSPNKPNIIGECNYPKRLFRKEIRNLTEEDLGC